MSESFKPFADDTAALAVGGVTIENGTDRISLSGSLDLARDRQGLDHARALRAALNSIIAALEAGKELPAEASQPARAKTTKAPNPFT